MELPPTDRRVLDDLLDSLAERPSGHARDAILALFDATVNDAQAAIRRNSEPVGVVCEGPQGRFGQLDPGPAGSLEVGTRLFIRS